MGLPARRPVVIGSKRQTGTGLRVNDAKARSCIALLYVWPHPQREREMAEKKPMANELTSRCWKPRADGLCLLPRDHDGPHEFTCGETLTAELNPLPIDAPTEGETGG